MPLSFHFYLFQGFFVVIYEDLLEHRLLIFILEIVSVLSELFSSLFFLFLP